MSLSTTTRERLLGLYMLRVESSTKPQNIRDAVSRAIMQIERNADATTVAVAKRDHVIDRYNKATDRMAKHVLSFDADRINANIYSHDLDIATIAYVMDCCGAYANDREHGLALCDNGCGDRLPYSLMVI
jgi:hypothetical protein